LSGCCSRRRSSSRCLEVGVDWVQIEGSSIKLTSESKIADAFEVRIVGASAVDAFFLARLVALLLSIAQESLLALATAGKVIRTRH
jgi:hypothetical protein